MGPMQGVQPNAKAKPMRKPLKAPGWPPSLRKWTSRLSQRVSEGQKKKLSEREKKSMAFNQPPKSPGCSVRASPAATSRPPISKPVRIVIFESQPTRCSPKRTIKEPARGASRLRLRTRKVPTALADAPNEIKTIEKPKTNARADTSSPPRGAFPSLSCSTPMPDSIEL